MRQGWVLRLLRGVERFLYSRCDAVVAITEGFRHYLLQLGLEPGRVAVIPNGVDWKKFAGVSPSDELRRREQLDGKFVVGYIGNIGLAQGLETLLEAAERLGDEPVAFLLLGEGIDKTRLAALAQARALKSVRFLEGVPRNDVPSVLATCDALVAMLRDDPLFEITIPSKIYEYMAAGKPILCSIAGETAALVAESSCGVPVRPSDGAALAESVRLLVANARWRRALGQAGAACARTRFARSELMEAYVTLVEGLSGSAFPPG
jgi:hypothetical protein